MSKRKQLLAKIGNIGRRNRKVPGRHVGSRQNGASPLIKIIRKTAKKEKSRSKWPWWAVTKPEERKRKKEKIRRKIDFPRSTYR